MKIIDPIALTQDLIRCQSVTPHDAGCMSLLMEKLTDLGFSCEIVRFGEVENLYAKLGNSSPHICFLGHTDVVPSGRSDLWLHPPFAGEIHDQYIYGRGACDMKGAIACFIASVSDYLNTHGLYKGSISILLTSDEEGPALNGTKKMVPWLQEKGEKIDYCLVGEPTNPEYIGEMVKIGRRGSLNVEIEIIGKAGHVAYPHFAYNPLTPLISVLHHLQNHVLDEGTDEFDPSVLTLTNIEVNNPTTNMSPSSAKALFNIRFNPTYTGESLSNFIHQQMEIFKNQYSEKFKWLINYTVSAESFINYNINLQNCIVDSIFEITEKKPTLSTSGGTSDARFIKDLCPAIEVGLLSCYAHQINERIHIHDLQKLTKIYKKILEKLL